MKLYGTTTSPFTRRVRIVAAELGEPIDWLDTASDTGQAALREITPIRKVPVALIDGRTLFDSRAIVEWLTATRGFGGIAPPRDRWRDQNLMNAIDTAIDSMIQLFYLRRDGIAIDDTPFARRQLDRTDAIFRWLGGELSAQQLGLPEISLICALDWMDFRKTYPTERAAALEPVRAAWHDRPSIASTRPHA
jgi:glutathione S-transferase